MEKWYVTRNTTINNKEYNKGDIVICNEEDSLYIKSIKSKREIKTYDGKYINNEKPIISVMVTFHNKERFVNKCIDSFIKQSIQMPYEIVVIDDSSTDGTTKKLLQYKDKVRYFRVENHSAAKSRNYGLKQLQGEYYVFFDGDDFCYPDYLEKLYKGIQDYDVCGTRFRFKMLEEKQVIPTCNFFEFDENNLDYCGAYNTPIMVRKEFGKKLKWDDNLFCFEDWNISLQLRKLKARVNLLKDVCWEYVSNGDSKWGSGEAHQKMKDNLKYIQKLYGLKTNKAEVTVFGLVSQDRTLKLYFDDFEKIDMPRNRMHYIIVVDSNDISMLNYVKERVKNYNFLTTKIYFTNEPNLYESHDFTKRAERITRNLKYMLNEVSKYNTYTPYFFMVEDDTLAPRNAFKKLWKHIKSDSKIAYASGVESSKCKDRHLGLCYLKTDKTGDLVYRVLPKPKRTGVESFDGGGWYCWIGQTEAIRKCSFRIIENVGRHLGPDTLMVYELKQKGWKCVMDWSIACKHYDYIKKQWIKVSDGIGYDYFYKKLKEGAYSPIIKKL